MDIAIKELAEIANSLDNKGMLKAANNIDSILTGLVTIKTAQYVGVQGYWLRNSRCWNNCYRQKRAKNPKLAAQQVWEACHKEYVESINNDNSGWEKYASKDTSFIKVASNSNVLKSESSIFQDFYKKNIEMGISPNEAMLLSTKNGLERYSEQILEVANSIIKVAENLKGDKELSLRLAKVSSDLAKEAQFGGWLNKMWSGTKGLFQDNVAKQKSWIKDLENQIYNVFQTARQDTSKGEQLFLQLQRNVQSKLPQMNVLFGNDENAKGLIQTLNVFISATPGNRMASAKALLQNLRAYSIQLDQPKTKNNQQPNVEQKQQAEQQKPDMNAVLQQIYNLLIQSGFDPNTAANAVKSPETKNEVSQDINSGASPQQAAQEVAKEISQEGAPATQEPSATIGEKTLEEYFNVPQNRSVAIDSLNKILKSKGAKFILAKDVFNVFKLSQTSGPTNIPDLNLSQPTAAPAAPAAAINPVTFNAHMEALANELLGMTPAQVSAKLSKFNVKVSPIASKKTNNARKELIEIVNNPKEKLTALSQQFNTQDINQILNNLGIKSNIKFSNAEEFVNQLEFFKVFFGGQPQAKAASSKKNYFLLKK